MIHFSGRNSSKKLRDYPSSSVAIPVSEASKKWNFAASGTEFLTETSRPKCGQPQSRGPAHASNRDNFMSITRQRLREAPEFRSRPSTHKSRVRTTLWILFPVALLALGDAPLRSQQQQGPAISVDVKMVRPSCCKASHRSSRLAGVSSIATNLIEGSMTCLDTLC